jgi:hypothetical protein
MSRLLLLLPVSVLIMFSCREPFDPEINPADLSVLVVEGYLDTEGIPTTLKLSFTKSITEDDASSSSSFFPGTGMVIDSRVYGANIFLESSTGGDYFLTEQGEGTYLFENNIPENEVYQLHIQLKDGKSYTSFEMQPIITPKIQDIGFERNEDGVEVYITTQGDKNADKFLWTFTETWAFRPKIVSPYIYRVETGKVDLRTQEERIDLCFNSKFNSDLLLETSTRFEDQFVFRKSITQIPVGDEKISYRYSILISQEAIDQKASEFWEIMRKNSSDLGSIFSPLPSNIRGNITQDQDPTTPVIGYISMGTVRQERLYIDFREVLPWRLDVSVYSGCVISRDSVVVADYDAAFRSGNILPVSEYIPDGAINPTAYFSAPRFCSDCTLRGSNVKPDFWED